MPELEERIRVADARVAELDAEADRIRVQLRDANALIASQKAAIAEADALKGAFGKLVA